MERHMGMYTPQGNMNDDLKHKEIQNKQIYIYEIEFHNKEAGWEIWQS